MCVDITMDNNNVDIYLFLMVATFSVDQWVYYKQ